MATPTKANNRIGPYLGKTFKDESFRAYVPPPLPPDPPLVLPPLLPLLEQANQALGRLDGLASILPDPSLFIYLYVRKEAVLSSQIEGTQSSFSDLMLFESADVAVAHSALVGVHDGGPVGETPASCPGSPQPDGAAAGIWDCAGAGGSVPESLAESVR